MKNLGRRRSARRVHIDFALRGIARPLGVGDVNVSRAIDSHLLWDCQRLSTETTDKM
jgi:hypothetical protein